MSEGKRPVGRPRHRGLHMLKGILKKCGGTEPGTGRAIWQPNAGHGSKSLGFIECGEFYG